MSATFADRDDAGFTLIEVLVGFVIVTLGLVSFYSGVGLSYRHLAESQRREEALGRARSHLETLGHTVELTAGSTSGTYTNGLHWRLSIAELAGSTGTAVPSLVILDTYDRGNRHLGQLRTVKLAPIRQ